MKYSVVTPCFNEAHVLKATLASLKEAIGERRDVEVIFVDNGSTDGSVEMIKDSGFISYVVKGVKISALRNFGVSQSSGSHIYFLDADMLVPSNVFDALDRFIEEAEYNVLGYVDLAPEDAPWFARTWSLRTLARRATYKNVKWLPGRNILVPRLYYDKAKGFNENLLTGEDKDFVFRLGEAGAKVVSDPRLRLTHLGYERTFKQWCLKEYWRQHSNLQLSFAGKFKLRLLRFPLLAIFHLIIFGIVPFSFSLGWGAALGLLSLWVLPSLIMTAAYPVSRNSGLRFFQFWLLYFIRFHIASFSIIAEVCGKFFRRVKK